MFIVKRKCARYWPGVAAAGLLLAAGVTWAYPVPSRVPTRWQLKFEPGPLRLYQTTGQIGAAENYWYFTYKVTNFTGEERYWAPRFTLFGDDGAIIDSGHGVPPSVEQEILNLLGSPYLARQNQVIGRIFVGEPNAIEGLVVWPASSMDVTELSVFISGISGETTQVTNPSTGRPEVMQKTLQRDYVVPGDPQVRGDDPIELEAEQWVMR